MNEMISPPLTVVWFQICLYKQLHLSYGRKLSTVYSMKYIANFHFNKFPRFPEI